MLDIVSKVDWAQARTVVRSATACHAFWASRNRILGQAGEESRSHPVCKTAKVEAPTSVSEARERARAVNLQAAVRDDADAGARQRLLEPRLADAALQPDHLCTRRSA